MEREKRTYRRRTSEDWEWIVKEAITGLQTAPKSELLGLLRKKASERFGRRVASKDLKDLLEKMKSSKVIIEMQKQPVNIGEWNDASDIVMFKVNPENIRNLGQSPETPVEEKTEVSEKKPIKFTMGLDIKGKDIIQKYGNVKTFPELQIISVEIQIQREDPEVIQGFLDDILKLSEGGIRYSFDSRINPELKKVLEEYVKE
jgi:hypothetical protein